MLEKLVVLLPESWQPRAKAIALALGTIAGFVVLYWTDAPEWVSVAVGALTWLGVYKVPNVGYDYQPRHAETPGE